MKATELRELSPEELMERYRETRQEMFQLRLQQTLGQLEKASRIRELRHDVARMKTILNERTKAAK